jgi:hypothetical protein
MDITINLATGGLVRSASNRQAVSTLRFKRGDSSVIRVFFVDGVSTVPVQLPVGTTGKFGLKEQGKYDDGFVVSDVSWTPIEDDGLFYYVFEPNFNTIELNTLLGIGTAQDKASVTLMGEIEWISSGAISSSVTFSAVVQNDVIRGDEGVPTDADPAYPDVPQIPLWRSDITALTGGTPDALDSLPTSGGLYDGRIVIVATPFAIYQLINSNDAEDSPGIIRPDDFAASTNEKVWIQRL